MNSQEEEALVMKIRELYEQISKLESLKPSKNVDMLFGQLVATCIPPNPIDVTKLPSKTLQSIRSKLIRLCAQAESYLESHYSSLLGSSSHHQNPLHHLHLFPYFSNYLKLTQLEHDLLFQHLDDAIPSKIAFLGSGPLPLTSILLATHHLPNTVFHNYDIDASANAMAIRLVSSDSDISRRMFFHTADVMSLTSELREYEVVFLAALVGMDKEEKVRVIDHVGKYMGDGAILMLRSAHGARGFLYPVVDTCDDLKGWFEVLSVYHPTDDVINSVVIARRVKSDNGGGGGQSSGVAGCMLMPCNCSKMHIAAIQGKNTIMEKQLS